jgi:hypothetical protein
MLHQERVCLCGFKQFEDYRERGPVVDRIVRWRTVAKMLSTGLVVRRCFALHGSVTRSLKHVCKAPLDLARDVSLLLGLLTGLTEQQHFINPGWDWLRASKG